MAFRHEARRGHTHSGSSGEISLALDDLTDVSATSPAANDLLQWTGSQWATSTVASVTGSLDHGNLSGLSDDDHPQYGHLSQNETVSGSWTFTANPEISGTAPGLYWNATSAGTDQKYWEARVAGQTFTFRTRNDDNDDYDNALRFIRDGVVVDEAWAAASTWGFEWDIPVGWSTTSSSDSFAQFLRFGNASGAYDASNYGVLEIITDSVASYTTSATGAYEATGCRIDKTELTNGEDYLIIATGNIRNNKGITGHAYRMTVAGATTIPGILGHFETTESTSRNCPFAMHFVLENCNTATDDIEIEIYSASGSGAAAVATGLQIMAINLSDLGAANWENTYSGTDVSTSGLSSGQYRDSAALITATNGNSADDWLFFSTAEYDLFTGGTSIEERFVIDGTPREVHTDVGMNSTGGNKVCFGWCIVQAMAPGTTIRTQFVKTGSVNYSVINQNITGINISKLADAQNVNSKYYSSEVAYTAEVTNETAFSDIYTANTDGNGYAFAIWQADSLGLTYGGPMRLKGSIDGGADALLDNSTNDTQALDWATNGSLSIVRMSEAGTALTTGQTWEVKFKHDIVGTGYASGASQGYFMLTWIDKTAGGGGSGGQFTAGNATYSTVIKGLDTTIASALNVDGATTLDTTLGVTGATTLSSTLGVTGATTLSSTLDVTGATTITAGGEALLLSDDSGTGSAAQVYLAFDDDAATRLGYVGFGSALNSDMYFYNDSGNVRLRGTDVILQDGTGLQIYDASNTDYVDFSHDGTDFNIAGVTTTAANVSDMTWQHDSDTGADPFTITRTGAATEQLSMYVTANDAYFVLAQDETDSTAHRWVFDYQHSGAGNTAGAHRVEMLYEGLNRHRFYTNNANSGYYMFGGDFRLYDNGHTDFAAFDHDGTDFNTAFTNTTDWNITGASAIRFDNFVINPTATTVTVRDGDSFRIADSANTSYINLAHNGTDLLTTFAGTTDWNITGITEFQLGSDVALYSSQDFDADGASDVLILGDPTYNQLRFRTTTAGEIKIIPWTFGTGYVFGAEAWYRHTEGDWYFEAGLATVGDFTMYNTGLTDTAVFSHDGTDFNTTFTNTTDWNINGADTTNVNFVDTKVLFSNGSNNFYGVMTDSLSMASGDGWCNILSCAAGNGRGGGTLMISHSGGSGAPDVMEVKIPTSWDAETPAAMILKASAGTGVSSIRLGFNSADSSASVDVQVSQAVAQTYKLIWRPYQISTAWDLTPSTTGSTVTSSREITVDDGHMWSLYGGSADTESLWFHPGTGFRIGNGGQTDYVQFDHDGTDFNISGTNTSQINVDTSTVFTLASGGASNSIEIRSTVPAIWMYDTGQATDESAYKMYVNAGDFMLRATNDSGGSTGEVLQLVRGTGAVVDYAQWHVPTKHEDYILIKERAAAGTDVASYGQLWIKNTTPCQLWFTDDAGTDTQIV